MFQPQMSTAETAKSNALKQCCNQ